MIINNSAVVNTFNNVGIIIFLGTYSECLDQFDVMWTNYRIIKNKKYETERKSKNLPYL